ncbi:hypothetical protein BBAD15_g8315 [Beauveria bassiana D1-5]|uniref:Transcription factor domain-containing protein n=1 Tax=Beauveria bassiana D1-5 TaxID=1245745 RepID=A0A0A2VJR4_BEABA|nr:hypothetical protein BBAD15_g8315 [Beauveria bassiana D1-5]
MLSALTRRVEQLENDLARRDVEQQLASPSTEQKSSPNSQTQRTPSHLESQVADSPTEDVFSKSASRTPRLSHQQLGRNWYFRGMQILSRKGQDWIEAKTGQGSPLEDYVTFEAQGDRYTYTNSQAEHDLSALPARELPEKRATLAIIDAFFDSTADLCFPVLDRALISATVDQAYCPSSAAQSLPAQACVWALNSWTRFFSLPAGLLTGVGVEACIGECKSILEKCRSEPSLEALQAILLVQEACCEDAMKDRKRQHVDNLFGLCYILDKNIALRLGRLPLLTEEYYDVNFRSAAPGLTELPHDYPSDPKLNLVKERTCRLLYSPKAAKLSDGEILQYIRQLDQELEQWRLSVPRLIRPRLSIPPDFSPLISESSRRQKKQLINLQLDYHYTMIAIHAMVRKCGAANEEMELPEDLHSVVHSSVDISLEASRSTLTFLGLSLRLLGRGASQYIQWYAPVAAMALFVNGLVHPLSDSLQTDLGALIQAVGIFQSIPLDTLSSAEARQIEKLSKFIVELLRLVSSAMWKAKHCEMDVD